MDYMPAMHKPSLFSSIISGSIFLITFFNTFVQHIAARYWSKLTNICRTFTFNNQCYGSRIDLFEKFSRSKKILNYLNYVITNHLLCIFVELSTKPIRGWWCLSTINRHECSFHFINRIGALKETFLLFSNNRTILHNLLENFSSILTCTPK